jgi:hypothetical protein
MSARRKSDMATSLLSRAPVADARGGAFSGKLLFEFWIVKKSSAQ